MVGLEAALAKVSDEHEEVSGTSQYCQCFFNFF